MSLSLDEFLALPRVASLHLSLDGVRLLATVQTVASDGKRFAGALWEIDLSGERLVRRLTHSAKGDVAAGFLLDGFIFFISPRPDVAATEGGATEAFVFYVLFVVGGESRRLLVPGGGVEGLLVVRDSSTVVLIVSVHIGAVSLEDDEKRETARKDAGVEAMLFDCYSMYWWDYLLAGRESHLMVLDLVDFDADPLVPRDLIFEVFWYGWLSEI